MGNLGDEPEPNVMRFTDSQGVLQTLSLSHERTLRMDPSHGMNRAVVSLHTSITALEFYDEAMRLFGVIDLKSYRGGPGFDASQVDLTPKQWYAAAVAQTLGSLATYGCSENSIGIAWQQYLPEPSSQARFVITKLSRDPQWTGMNILLKDLSNVGFRIYCDPQDRRLPDVAVGIPEPDDLKREPRKRFPQGQATVLRDVLAWHGAVSVWTGQPL